MTAPLRQRGDHGGPMWARVRRCRCGPCRAYRARSQREYRAKVRGYKLAAAPVLTAAQLGVPPFRHLLCRRCGATCVDDQDRPRFLLDQEVKPLCWTCGRWWGL